MLYNFALLTLAYIYNNRLNHFLQDSTSVSTVLAISNIVIGVSTLFIGVIIGVTVTYCITRNSSSQHEQRVSTNVSSDGPMYEETTTTNISNERFKMDKNDAYGPIR